MKLDKFLSKLTRTDNGCWLWGGYTKSDGYGWMTVNSKNITSHRQSWILHNGAIPDGMCVLHKCDVRACCNPEHLFLGTYADNNQDMWNKKRHPTPKGKLSIEQIKFIKKNLGTISQRTLGEMFGVRQTSISNISLGVTWSWV